ncbi:inositol monophosphatase family protein [Mycolicibacterium septicum]|uniref:inositol monophosphatase family protein n=1 Tax=Mycolicibacterium septicum TaxID=98668 RepID=UPI001F2DAD0D|nr:inositol monophosphatase family protein [Mycolicibacterium septicum]
MDSEQHDSASGLAAELVDVALEAARAGAAVLRSRPRASASVTVKGERGDLVTDVDVAAERAVRAVLSSRRPNDHVTGEELPGTAPAGARVRWSIDPLDGTTNFTRGIPYYATSVGAVCIATGQWLAGAVDAPVLGKTYYAYRGGGAWLAEATGVHRLTGPAAGGDGAARLLGMGYAYSADVRRAQCGMTAEMMAGYTDARALGSAALAICAVAEGALDGYVESHLGEYDWAAAALVAEEAGLAVRRPATVAQELRVTTGEPDLS